VTPGRAVGQNSVVLVASAAVAVPVAVASAIVAEEAAVHVAILGAITIVMGVLRVRLVGWNRGLLQFLTGCVVAQPVLHAAVKVVPHAQLDHGVGPAVGQADVFVGGTQLAVALALVVAVTFTEQLTATASGVVRVCWLRTRPVVLHATREGPSRLRTPVRAHPTSRYRPIAMPTRGPPRSPVPAR